MISYRDSLTKIGIPRTTPVSYRSFTSRPHSLRQAIASMDAPASGTWSQVSEIFRDDTWTDEVQGIGWDGANWIFSTNANPEKPNVNNKALYVFKGGQPLGDGLWLSMLKYKDVPHPVAGHEGDDHWGQLTVFQGSVFVAHFWSGGSFQPDAAGTGSANVVRFTNTNGVLTFSRWIELDQPTALDGRRARAEFQCVNPWDGMFYTCFGDGVISELFIHDPNTGKWTGRSLKLNPPVTGVQGACFSPHGHLYISTNSLLPSDERFQTIWYYSPLNGHQFGVIPVLAEEGLPFQELEGICFGGVETAGGAAQIHAILLENPKIALDNIFFKSFGSSNPTVV